MVRFVTRHRTTILCTAAVLAALVFPGMASAASYDFPLSGYWPMNEGKGQVVRDWSGNGNNGQLGSTAGVDANDPTWIRGIYGWSYGLHFDGGQFVTIPDSNDLEPQQVTVSAWFRGSGSPGEFKYLVAKGSNECVTGSYGLYTGVYGGPRLLRQRRVRLHVHGVAGSDPRGLGRQVAQRVGHVRRPDGAPVHRRQGDRHRNAARRRPDRLRHAGRQPPRSAPTAGTCDLSFTGDLDEVSIWKKPLPIAEIWKKAAILLQPH